jgi:hypothetical protein
MTLTLDQAVAELVHSPNFQAWGHSTIPAEDLGKSVVMGEKLYGPDELAELWSVSVDCIRKIFREEAGVFNIDSRNPENKRQYSTLRIPERVAERVHTRLSERRTAAQTH